MSNLPPDNDDAEADALYRRLSAADASRPADATRQAVLTHAMRLGRPAANDPAVRREYSWQRHERAWMRPTAFGALAAGILAVFMWPHLQTPQQVAVPLAMQDRSEAAPPVFAVITPSQPNADYRPEEQAESAAKVRQVPSDALRRQLVVPQAAEIDTAGAVASAPGAGGAR